MPLKCMYRCSCCSVWNVIYPYFWFDRSFGFTVTFLFSSTNFPFFLFFRPFLFNFVEPSSVRKKHAYTHKHTWTNHQKNEEKEVFAALLSILLAVKSRFFSLISKNKVLTSISCTIGCCFCVFIFHFIVVICVRLLLLVVVMVLQPFEQKRQIALIIYVVQRTTRDWKTNLFP